MDLKTVKEQIEKLRKSIASPAVDEKLKAGMRSKLEALAQKAKQLEQEEAASHEVAIKADDEKAPNPEKEKAPTGEKAPKAKATKENKQQVMDRCKPLITELRRLLTQYDSNVAAPKRASNAASKPARKKRASEIVSSGIVGTVARVVKMELTRDKVTKIKVDKLTESLAAFVSALKALRSGLGGIQSDNDGFIDDFEKDFMSLISQVKEKQKDVKQAA